MGGTPDLRGGSYYLWCQKHNVLHHTYTNIDVLDRDLLSSGAMRLSPNQTWLPHHRLQHWYALPLYSFGTLLWGFRNDYSAFLSGKFGPVAFATPPLSEKVVFWGGKLFHYGYALILPSFFHPVWQVILAYVGIHMVLGLSLYLVFQLAHTTEGPVFPKPDNQTGNIENDWAIHEVETTADFAPNNVLVTWCIGGLNFQIEHHLFPKVSHIHYPAIRHIVQDVCREHQVAYCCHPTFWAAIRAHFHFLKKMGQPPVFVDNQTPSHALQTTR
jgi:linoleoyl-CoA desaturase